MNFSGTLRNRIPKIILHTVLLITSFLMFFPILMMIMNSIKTPEEIRRSPLSMPKGIHFQNYIDAWQIGNFGRLFINSIIVTVATLALIYVASALASYVFARLNFKGKNIWFIIFLSGIMFPVQIAIIPLFKMITALGLVNNHLSLILVNATFGLPISIFILTAFIKTIPVAIEESATIDGCGKLGILFRIILPLIKPGMTTVMIFNGIAVWNDLLLPVIFMTSEKMKTLPAGLMYFSGQYTSQWEYITAAIIIMSLPIMLFYLLLQKNIINGLSAGAVKG